MNREKRLFLLNLFNGKRHWETDVYRRVHCQLTQKGINVKCPVNLSLENCAKLSHIISQDDLVIAHQPHILPLINGLKSFCEPSGIQLRSSRLKFMERMNFPVMDWVEANSTQNIDRLFEIWKCGKILFNQTDSFQSRGIKIIGNDDPLPERKQGDVFCRIMTHDPHTYKVDFFHNVILASYKKETPSVLDPKYSSWVTGDNRNQLDFPHQNRQFFYLPENIGKKIRSLGKTITSIGGGYASIDLMKTREGFKAIELNISEIATKYTWLMRPKQSAMNFTRGILNLWQDYSSVQIPLQENENRLRQTAQMKGTP